MRVQEYITEIMEGVWRGTYPVKPRDRAKYLYDAQKGKTEFPVCPFYINNKNRIKCALDPQTIQDDCGGNWIGFWLSLLKTITLDICEKFKTKNVVELIVTLLDNRRYLEEKLKDIPSLELSRTYKIKPLPVEEIKLDTKK